MDTFLYLSKSRNFALILYKTDYTGFSNCLNHI